MSLVIEHLLPRKQKVFQIFPGEITGDTSHQSSMKKWLPFVSRHVMIEQLTRKNKSVFSFHFFPQLIAYIIILNQFIVYLLIRSSLFYIFKLLLYISLDKSLFLINAIFMKPSVDIVHPSMTTSLYLEKKYSARLLKPQDDYKLWSSKS